MDPIAGRPFLEIVLNQLSQCGISRIVLCVGYRRSQIRKWFRHGTRWGLDISYSIEPSPLGTGGALANAAPLLTERWIFVLNGDTFVDLDFSAMLQYHREWGSHATVAVTTTTDSRRYGSVLLGTTGQVVGFQEKQSVSQTATKTLINAGVYLFNRNEVDAIPKNRPVSMETEVLPSLMANNRLFAFYTDGYFIDIGVPEDLQRAKTEIPRALHQ
jgi:D-glycero-alpha-D-manno-heptose 1-phosphate guanylyltransferase